MRTARAPPRTAALGAGLRRLYVRIAWKEISGREVGDEWLGASRRAADDSVAEHLPVGDAGGFLA